jgi:hypothetical protein
MGRGEIQRGWNEDGGFLLRGLQEGEQGYHFDIEPLLCSMQQVIDLVHCDNNYLGAALWFHRGV